MVAREVSLTAYRGLSGPAALRVDARAFPGLVNEVAGGAPRLGGGERLTGWVASNAARVAFAGGKRGLIVSTQPMALSVSKGRGTPIDLALRASRSGFVPDRALVGVRLPRRASHGLALAGSGVSLTPVSSTGGALGGAEGVVQGAAVEWAGTQVDTDTLAKPLTNGFELDSLLRSPASPQELDFRVGLPAGARLQRAGGAVRVIDGARVLAVVSAPSAMDAEGRPVRVALRVSGAVIRVVVARRAGAFTYPIVVDPTVTENVKEGSVLYGQTLRFFRNSRRRVRSLGIGRGILTYRWRARWATTPASAARPRAVPGVAVAVDIL